MKEIRALLTLLIMTSLVQAGDWPQWLGSRRDGSSDEVVKPWKEPLKITWKQSVGEGHSSPVISKGKVYLHTRLEDKNEEVLLAFDAVTGNPLWQQPYPRSKFSTPFGNGPRATPAVVDGKVYTSGITGLLTCFDADKGKQLWQVDTLKQYDTNNLFFGASCSPLIEGDLVIVNVGAKKASIVAFDRNTGKERWKTLDDRASYSSPIAIDQDGKKQIIVLTAKGLVSLNPQDGKPYWQSPLVDKLAESSTTPVVVGDLLFASSITFGGLALKMEAGPAVNKEWMKPEYNCYFSTPVAIGKDQLYLVTGTKGPSLTSKATLRCVDAATGKELWNRDRVGTYHASLLRTGDNKLILIEETGDMVLLEPDREKYREISRTHICGNTWAHPAIANGRLYIRDNKDLVSVELPE